MFTYSAYGLGIHSEIGLPEFTPAEVNRDVVVRLQLCAKRSPNPNDRHSFIDLDMEEAVLHVEHIGDFLVKAGREIVIIPGPEADDRLIRPYLVGTVMAILLYQRGLLVLHASAVQINNRALVLLGASGSGKSSLAAALYSRGHYLIADDVSGVQVRDNSILIFPAYPQLKLSPEAAASLGLNSHDLFRLHETEEQFGLGVRQGFSTQPVKLGAIYLLSDEHAHGIDTLAPQEAVVELIRHSLPTRFCQPGDQTHFLKCINIVTNIPFFCLNKASSIHWMPELAFRLEEHFVAFPF
jgi:hypothetical protein